MKKLKSILCLTILLFFSITSAAAMDSTTISSGLYVDYVIAEDGRLFAWGADDYGLLGEDEQVVSPLGAITLMKNARFVEGGRNCVFVIDSNNTLWSIGSNWFGLRTSYAHASVTQPSVVLRDVMQVSVGERHCLAVKTDGSLWGWGFNEFGQLGTPKPDPTLPYNGLLLDPVQLMDSVSVAACSAYGSYALTKEGKLLGWGALPIWGSTGSYDWSEPCELMDDVMSIEEYGFIKKDHSLWAWVRQEGEGTQAQFTLEKIMDDVKQSSAGEDFFAVVKTDGSLWTWGRNNSTGQLGNGTTLPNSQPQKIMEQVFRVHCASEHCLILTKEGELWQIGYPHTTALAVPELEKVQFYLPFLLLDGMKTVDAHAEKTMRSGRFPWPCSIFTLPFYWLEVILYNLYE